MPGCPYCRCMVWIRSGGNWAVRAAHIRGEEMDLCLINSNHFFGTQVRSSVKFCSDATKVTSTWRPYSRISCCRIVNFLQTRILLEALVLTRALPVSASVRFSGHLSLAMCRWTILACHCNVRLRPFTEVSSSAKFICWASFVGRS